MELAFLVQQSQSLISPLAQAKVVTVDQEKMAENTLHLLSNCQLELAINCFCLAELSEHKAI